MITIEDFFREWLKKTIETQSFQAVVKESIQIQQDLKKQHKVTPSQNTAKEIDRLVNIVLLLDERLQQQTQVMSSMQQKIEELEKEIILARIEVAQSKIAAKETTKRVPGFNQ